MSMSLADLDRWDPNAIHEVFSAVTGHSEATRQTSQSLGQVMASVPLEGAAHDAAMRASSGIQRDLDLHADQLDAVANAASTAETEVRGIKSDWQKICRMADRWGITIDIETNEILPPNPQPTDPDDIAELERRMGIIHDEIVELLDRANNADRDLAAAIDGANGTMSAADVARELHDGPHTPMDNGLGAGDGLALQSGQLTDRQRQRLTEATTLSPSQLEALQRGDLVLPPDQLGYLIGVSQALGDKTPQQVSDLIGKLGPDGDKLASALHVASNPYISSGVPGQGKPGTVGYVPDRGGKFALPQGLANAPVMQEFYPRPGTPGQPGGGMPKPLAPPMANQQLMALANIAAKGDPGVKMGSGLDVLVLDKAHALVTASNDQALPMGPAGAEMDRTIRSKNSIDPTLQRMLDVVHADSLVIHDAVTGAAVDGLSADSGRGQQFLADMFNHDYADGGKSVGSLFHNIEGQAVVHDPGNATEVALAERAGQTAHAAAFQLGDKWQHLLNLNGAGDSLGQMNPELAQSLSHALSHDIPDMMNNRLEDTRGFGLLDGALGVGEGHAPLAQGVFAVLDSDDAASRYINKAAEGYTVLWHHELAQSIAKSLTTGDSSTIDYADATTIGEMYGIRDHANLVEANDRITDHNLAAQAAYDRRKAWIDGLDGVGSSVPIAGQYASTAAYVLNQMFLGDAPTPSPLGEANIRASTPAQYALAAEL
ncbi:TPR repeat region-containing protein [Mycolicibacterium sarraceniae]|uniref:TPR repeat domain-containing protein n=1 Tax=Mycolicibacterium sarraceniae TaxID=1534348 RepID=A0A7I7SM61_9MYCO|nr:hypothetical protein [Mycolicibacterium sarraceniae]BBY58087.1 hypothetical protein MSAR_12230 [Mycolicibacterium sarraceniae]